MRSRRYPLLAVLVSVVVALAGCGGAVAGRAVVPAGETFVLSAAVPACGGPETVRYADGTTGTDNAPGYVGASSVDGPVATVLLDGQTLEVEVGASLEARGGLVHVVATDEQEYTVTVRFVPDPGNDTGNDTGVPAAVSRHAACPPPPG